ncbi:hypothetical protein [Brevundimonas sp.]|uniref:hypothetical protein n=1 Tax=Brevundimonas sp. TaxID=1871086 RepID=UPI002FC782B3
MTNDDIALIERIFPEMLKRISEAKPWKNNIFIPDMSVYRVDPRSEFMRYSTCSSRDFFHPEFKRLSDLIGIPEVFHRKYWEWVFVTHHAFAQGVTGPNTRGIVFGVGQETLPAIFAATGMRVTATDAPRDTSISQAWSTSNEYASELAAMPSGTLSREEFESLVEWRECDMNVIPTEFKDYDLCWSSCCLEHLGSLQHGIDFIINSVENTLKIGGVAIHTTELNLSSNDHTVETGHTVLYRRKDLEQLVRQLEDRGHTVQPFLIAPDSLVIDGFVDTPPYEAPPHLKLALGGYVTTSAGLVIRRGK